jgi:hypothetical protein
MGLLGESALEAKPTTHASSGSDLGARIYNIYFGAMGDGVALDTTALQPAISGNERIVVDGGDISNVTTALAFKAGANNSAVKLQG